MDGIMGGSIKLKSLKSTLVEKIIYGLGGVGANLCWSFMTMFVTMYYTNSVGISAAVVGTFMLVSRVLDGVCDMIFAALMRKVRTKLGLMRHWFLISAPLLGISLFLCFNIPSSLSLTQRGIYAFITYALTGGVSYTIFNLAFSSFLPLMSLDDQDRTKTSSVGNFIILAGVMAMSFATPLLLAAKGGENTQGAWTFVSLIYSILCTIFVAMIALIKEKQERVQQDVSKEQSAVKESKISFGTALKYVFGNRYSWIMLGVISIYCMYSGLLGINYYYTVYIFGGVPAIIERFGVTVLFISQLAGTIALLLGMTLTPTLFVKLGKRNTVLGGLLVTAVFSLLVYISPSNFVFYTISKTIAGLGTAPMMVAMFVFIADISTYVLKKKHVHVEEVVAMCSSIGTKIGTGLGAAVVGWGLSFSNFNGEAAVQEASAITGITFLSNGLPAIICVIAVILLAFWNIDKKMAQMDN